LNRLSGLPLALTQAAAYIGQTAVSISQYLEYYDSMWKDLMEHQHEYSLQEYAERSVLTTWKISYEQVKSQNEGASNLLRLWSYLYAGDLWYELISCAKELAAKNDVPDWLRVLAKHNLKFDDAMRLLNKYSLVETKAETASYAMHSVLHSWCRYLGTSETERDLFQKLAIQIVGWMSIDQSTEQYPTLLRRLLPHSQAVFNGLKLKTEAEMNINETWAWNNIANMLGHQDRYMEAEEIFERALDRTEKALGSTHTSTLDLVNGLGAIYYNQGRLVEAEAMFKRALAGIEKALGPTHTSTLGTVNNLGAIYYKQDRLVEAEAMFKRALAGKEKALGPTYTSTLEIVNNLGLLYHDQGKLADAEAMYKRALAGMEKALGPTHTSTLDIVHNLGNLYRKQGRLVEAKAMYERALSGTEKTLGPEHTSTLRTLNGLGDLYRDQGKLADAKAMYKRALAGREKTLGPTHTSTLDLVNGLGVIYYNQGRLVEAEAMYKRALAGMEKALGARHQSTMGIANNLANLHDRQAALQRLERSTARDS
jgi:tetratricopeptide (TPR) repeat protein